MLTDTPSNWPSGTGRTPNMKGLCIGTVWCQHMAGSFAMVDIVLHREGRLVAKPGMNMRD